MTHAPLIAPLLLSATNPHGRKLEDILEQLVAEIRATSATIAKDHGHLASFLLGNNRRICENLGLAVRLQEMAQEEIDDVGPIATSVHL